MIIIFFFFWKIYLESYFLKYPLEDDILYKITLVWWSPFRQRNVLHRIFRLVIHLPNIDLIYRNLWHIMPIIDNLCTNTKHDYEYEIIFYVSSQFKTWPVMAFRGYLPRALTPYYQENIRFLPCFIFTRLEQKWTIVAISCLELLNPHFPNLA